MLAACAPSPKPDAGDSAEHTIQANDNRRSAGTLRAGVLTLHLEIGEGVWQSERSLAPYRVFAFGEEGAARSTPGPLIRVREGTVVEVALGNRLDRDIVVHGLGERPETSPPLRVRAHDTSAVRFRAARVGTFYYWGTSGDALDRREGRDSQLTGALVVDPREGTANDRVFVIGRLGSTADGIDVGSGLGAWVINGQSWPDTERLTYRVGETVTWRWINATGHRHPMHLHGNYFRVTSTGDNVADIARPADRQNPVVTQVMAAGSTMTMIWSPTEPGNWLFHCHNLFHVMPDNRLPVPQWYEEYADLPHDQHMAGLVLGIHALPAQTEHAARDNAIPRHIAMRVRERAGVRYRTAGLDAPGLGYAVDGSAITAPGPAIVLERGQPVEIAIANDIAHATSVHWHGVELESYYDGVPHWGGDSRNVTPEIKPGEVFLARFTPPRSGTFIYHTHFNDYIQLATGLYGALIVVEPGRAFPSDLDHVFIVSQGGLDDQKDPVLLNGAVDAPATRVPAHSTQRLRFIGITASPTAHVRLLRDGRLVQWRPLAKDGADLPRSLAVLQLAELDLSPGETYDFEVDVGPRGVLELDATLLNASGQHASTRLMIQ
jgi:FtsP/CotA-like multicopper oxidase with cupredoxin domain